MPYYLSTHSLQGEYRNSNNCQDDVQVMQQYIPLLPLPTSGYSIATAIPLNISSPQPIPDSGGSSTAIGMASGVISRPDQVDVYVFHAEAAGEALVLAQGLADWGGVTRGNLDMQVSIKDSSGSDILPASDSGDSLGVTVNVQLPAAGAYYLKVQGTGYKDFKAKAYSSYGSLGRYMVTVKFPVTPAGYNGDTLQPPDEEPLSSGPTIVP
jgi:hypothetical protein